MEIEISEERIKADILHKLYRKAKWGGAHTAIEHLYKHAPPRYHHEYKKCTESLVKLRLLLPKKTFYGLQVSLNPEKREEIISLIKRFFEQEC